jgi:hypothetical protein
VWTLKKDLRRLRRQLDAVTIWFEQTAGLEPLSPQPLTATYGVLIVEEDRL